MQKQVSLGNVIKMAREVPYVLINTMKSFFQYLFSL